MKSLIWDTYEDKLCLKWKKSNRNSVGITSGSTIFTFVTANFKISQIGLKHGARDFP